MKKLSKKLIWGAIIILIIFVIFFNQSYGDSVFDLSKLQNFVSSLGIFGPIILILLLIFQGILSFFPATILFILAGTSFGFFLGTFYCLIGTLLGATIAFKIAKKYGKKVEYYLLSKKNAEDLIKFTKDRKGYLTSVGRIFPLFPVDLISFSAGIENMKYRKFILTSALGFLVPIMAFILLGEVLLQSSLKTLTGMTLLSLIGMFFIQQNHSKILKFFINKHKK